MVTITPQLFKSPQELGHCDNYADLCEGDIACEVCGVYAYSTAGDVFRIDSGAWSRGFPAKGYDYLEPRPYDYTASYHMGMPKWYIDFVNKYCGWMV